MAVIEPDIRRPGPETNLRPSGFRFLPTDDELLRHYLYNYVKHIYGPEEFFPIRHRDIHSDEPWELWQSSQIISDNGGSGPENDVYFFADLKKTRYTDKNHGRKIGKGGGHWHGEDRGNKLTLEIDYPGGGEESSPPVTANWVGLKKRFSYRNGNLKSEQQKWILHEYRISYDGGSSYFSEVVCRLRNNKSPTARQISAAFVRVKRPIEEYINVRAEKSDCLSKKRLRYSNPLTSQHFVEEVVSSNPSSVEEVLNSVFSSNFDPIVLLDENVTCLNPSSNQANYARTSYNSAFSSSGFGLVSQLPPLVGNVTCLNPSSNQLECDQCNPYYIKNNAPMLEASCSYQDTRISTYQLDPLTKFSSTFEQGSTSNVATESTSEFGSMFEQGSTSNAATASTSEFDTMYGPITCDEICKGVYRDPTPLGLSAFEIQSLLYPSSDSVQCNDDDHQTGGIESSVIDGALEQQQQIVQIPEDKQQPPCEVISDEIVLKDDDTSWFDVIDFDCDASWLNVSQYDIEPPTGFL